MSTVNRIETEETEIQFANLNGTAETLDYLQATSAANLLEQIKQIRKPMRIVSIYVQGQIHFAWIQVHGKIKKVSKGRKI